MTCIVGLVAEDGAIWIGGDSAGLSGYDLTIRRDEKVFQNGEFLFGFTDSFRMGQILRYSFTPPAFNEDIPLHAYMVTTFVDSLRKCFKESGFATIENGHEKGGNFLVGTRGHLFVVYSDYQVEESIFPYNACGCGLQSALAAMYTLSNMAPEPRIRKALETASKFSAGVVEPFTVLSIQSPQPFNQ